MKKSVALDVYHFPQFYASVCITEQGGKQCFLLSFFSFLFVSKATDNKDEEIKVPKKFFLGMY